MKILITGIGNIGKSTLRECVANRFAGRVMQIDMDYFAHEPIPSPNGKDILVEDVHGLERNPEQYDRIVYLMPPRNHVLLWFRRAWAWFSSGIVDLSDPKGEQKPYSLRNVPIILRIALRNIALGKRWVSSDIQTIKKKLSQRTVVVETVHEGCLEIAKMLSEHEENQ